MTDKKPTGVFVRLPIPEVAARKIRAALDTPSYEPERLYAALLAIGTPVTGGELEVVGIRTRDMRSIATSAWHYSGDVENDASTYETQFLVRQSDALAKLAEKDVEIARLQKIVDVFSAKISECGAEGYDLSGADCVDLLNEAGVIEWGSFDPEVHDRAMFDGCEPGDPIWTLKGPGA